MNNNNNEAKIHFYFITSRFVLIAKARAYHNYDRTKKINRSYKAIHVSLTFTQDLNSKV